MKFEADMIQTVTGTVDRKFTKYVNVSGTPPMNSNPGLSAHPVAGPPVPQLFHKTKRGLLRSPTDAVTFA